MMRYTIVVQNLKCGGCTNTIITKLNTLDTISNIEVEVETSKVSFNYTSSNDLALVRNKLIQFGYPSIGFKNTITSKVKSFVSSAIGQIV